MDLFTQPLHAIGLYHVAVALVFAGFGLPLARGQVPMNRWFGARFSQSYRSPRHWYAINRYTGRRMLAFGAILAITGMAGLVVGSASETTIVLYAAAPGILAVLLALDSYLFASRYR